MKKIIQITDTHLFASPSGYLDWIPDNKVYTNRQLKYLLEYIQKKHSDIDHIIFTGDIAQEVDKRTYQYFRQLIAPIPIPISILPGNHDDNLSFYQELDKNTIKNNCNIQYDNWQILLIDSSLCEEPHGYLTEHQFKLLKKRLDKTEKFTVIALHHHPISTNSHWIDKHMLKNGQQLINIIRNYNCVKGLIFGHIHHAFDTTLHQIQFLGCPSTCVQFVPNQNQMECDHSNPGYRIIELHDNGLLTSQIHYIKYDD